MARAASHPGTPVIKVASPNALATATAITRQSGVREKVHGKVADWKQRDHRRRGYIRQRNTDGARRDRQHDGLRKQLADDARA
jgi:hypothetical protein